MFLRSDHVLIADAQSLRDEDCAEVYFNSIFYSVGDGAAVAPEVDGIVRVGEGRAPDLGRQVGHVVR